MPLGVGVMDTEVIDGVIVNVVDRVRENDGAVEGVNVAVRVTLAVASDVGVGVPENVGVEVGE